MTSGRSKSVVGSEVLNLSTTMANKTEELKELMELSSVSDSGETVLCTCLHRDWNGSLKKASNGLLVFKLECDILCKYISV